MYISQCTNRRREYVSLIASIIAKPRLSTWMVYLPALVCVHISDMPWLHVGMTLFSLILLFLMGEVPGF